MRITMTIIIFEQKQAIPDENHTLKTLISFSMTPVIFSLRKTLHFWE